VPAVLFCSNAGRPTAGKRIQNDIVLKGIKLDAAVREFKGEGGRVANFPGLDGLELPDGFGPFKEILFLDGVFPVFFGAFENFLAEDQNIFMDVPQNGIAGGAPASSGCGRTGAGGFVPDDLSEHQISDGKHLFDDERM